MAPTMASEALDSSAALMRMSNVAVAVPATPCFAVKLLYPATSIAVTAASGSTLTSIEYGAETYSAVFSVSAPLVSASWSHGAASAPSSKSSQKRGAGLRLVQYGPGAESGDVASATRPESCTLASGRGGELWLSSTASLPPSCGPAPPSSRAPAPSGSLAPEEDPLPLDELAP